MMNKIQFEIVDYNQSVIMSLASNGFEFSQLWSTYLTSSGWTENEYEIELGNRLFKTANQN